MSKNVSQTNGGCNRKTKMKTERPKGNLGALTQQEEVVLLLFITNQKGYTKLY